MKNSREKFINIFMEANTNEYKICEKCFPILLEQDSAEALETFFILMEEYILNSEEPLEEEEKIQISGVRKKHTKLLDSMLESLIKENASMEIFYEKLWSYLKNMPLCDKESEKTGVLYLLCRNDLIPYYRTDEMVEIEDHELWEMIEKNKKNIVNARSIIKQCAICGERVRYAAMLMELLNQYSDDRDKIVIMSYILRFVEVNTLDMMRQRIMEKADENR